MLLMQSAIFGIIIRQKKVKSPYFMLIAWNSHLTNKSEADSALILPPSPPLLPYVLQVFKAT